ACPVHVIRLACASYDVGRPATGYESTIMTNKEMQCPQCKGEMVQGFVPDYVHDARSLVVAWFAGPPKKSFWSKTKAPRGDGVPVGAFRCQKCGFLEFYSDAKFAAQ